MDIEKAKARLLENSVNHPATFCWLWQGQTNQDGYGQIWIDGIRYQVHRLSAHIFLGLNLDDKEQLALHQVECPNKNCWHHLHLYIGNRSQNAKDAYRLGRVHPCSVKTHCKYGHEYSPENTRILGSGSRACIQCEKDRWLKRKTSSD